jgi:peptide/nickel transport system permease protein
LGSEVTKRIIMRVTHSLLSLLLVLILVFCLVRLTGDPINFLLEPGSTRAQQDAVRRELNLDRSLPLQFTAYLGQLSRGDLGISYTVRRPVLELMAQRAPATLVMGAGAIFLTVLVGLPLGVYAAYWRGGAFDRTVRGMAAIFQSLPDFWVGFVLILVFAIWWKLLPAGGYGQLKHLVLPSVTLALPAIAGLARLLRSSILEELGSDYVLFHRIKGLSERKILWKHALRNGGLTTLSFLGVVIAGLFTGSVLVETIFNWQGLGLLFITGISDRDFGVVQGVMLVYATAYIGVNLFVDLLYTFLNPRLRSS